MAITFSSFLMKLFLLPTERNNKIRKSKYSDQRVCSVSADALVVCWWCVQRGYDSQPFMGPNGVAVGFSGLWGCLELPHGTNISFCMVFLYSFLTLSFSIFFKKEDYSVEFFHIYYFYFLITKIFVYPSNLIKFLVLHGCF